MFGKKREEQLQRFLNNSESNRNTFVEQAKKDRQATAAQIVAIQNNTTALAEATAAQIAAIQTSTTALAEAMSNDRKNFAEQAEKDRQAILEAIEKSSIANNTLAIEKGQEKKAAYALNLCTVSVSQIIDYNDLAIMEQEYDNILNNLNLENMPKDETLLNILKQILDVISFFRIQDGEKKLLEEQYKKRIKNAIWSAVPSPSVIIAGGKAGWAGLAVSAISAIGTGYMNYRKERATIDDEKKQKDWELQKSAMEQFHALRRELFDTAWRLADTYNFRDEYRLTERQISQYNRILTEEDPAKRYERLDYIKDRFEAYPPFWYYLGHAASEVFYNQRYSNDLRLEYKQHALVAFANFLELTNNESKKNSLLREDQLRAACALEKFALCSNDDTVSVKDKADLLKIAAKNSGNAFDTLQLCATSYLQIGETEQAIRLLRMLVNEDYNAEMNVQLLSMLYVSSIQTGMQKYKSDHELLCKRGFAPFMFPWPQVTLNAANIQVLTDAFIKSQNKYLFDQYKDTVEIYIGQCVNTFNSIAQQKGDITEAIIAFLQGVKNDLQTLFDDAALAQKVCDQIADCLLTQQDLLSNDTLRHTRDSFTFETISQRSMQTIAEKIKHQASSIHFVSDPAEKTQYISLYMGNLFLFKAQVKIMGGLAVSKVKEQENTTGFEKLIAHSKKNKVAQRYTDIINKHKEKLILTSDKKQKATLITEYFLESKNVLCKDKIKELGLSKVLAYLDVNSGTDILFTTEGICTVSKGLFTTKIVEVPYTNYSEIKIIDDKLTLGDTKFSHDQVDLVVLKELIRDLSNLVSHVPTAKTVFLNIVGNFPY